MSLLFWHSCWVELSVVVTLVEPASTRARQQAHVPSTAQLDAQHGTNADEGARNVVPRMPARRRLKVTVPRATMAEARTCVCGSCGVHVLGCLPTTCRVVRPVCGSARGGGTALASPWDAHAHQPPQFHAHPRLCSSDRVAMGRRWRQSGAIVATGPFARRGPMSPAW